MGDQVGANLQVYTANWQPSDAATDEARAIIWTPAYVPARGDYVARLLVRYEVGAESGSTPSVEIRDAAQQPLWHHPLAANLLNTYPSNIDFGGDDVIFADGPITAVYAAGATPGATRPALALTLLVYRQVLV